MFLSGLMPIRVKADGQISLRYNFILVMARDTRSVSTATVYTMGKIFMAGGGETKRVSSFTIKLQSPFWRFRYDLICFPGIACSMASYNVTSCASPPFDVMNRFLEQCKELPRYTPSVNINIRCCVLNISIKQISKALLF